MCTIRTRMHVYILQIYRTICILTYSFPHICAGMDMIRCLVTDLWCLPKLHFLYKYTCIYTFEFILKTRIYSHAIFIHISHVFQHKHTPVHCSRRKCIHIDIFPYFFLSFSSSFSLLMYLRIFFIAAFPQRKNQRISSVFWLDNAIVCFLSFHWLCQLLSSFPVPWTNNLPLVFVRIIYKINLTNR